MKTIEDIEEISEELFFVAASPAMRKLRTQAELLARVNVPVLILGENGSGKEIAARLIHKLSVRSGCRFLKVNCAAIPGDLLEGELFGYEPGAFRGATGARQGKFEICHKGTILLDEIAEMPAALQAKLLQVLQDQQFFRLGGDKKIAVDVRILAATSVNVDQALADKALREDLYYRLSAFTLQVPPLRERREEIPLLLGHFMNQMARHYNLRPLPFSAALVDVCQHYAWPGNLRQLENVVKRYLVMRDEAAAFAELEGRPASHMDETAWARVGDDAIGLANGNGDSKDPGSLKTLVRSIKGEAERTAISSTLEKTHWNRKEAARQLGISYRGLLYKIRDYELAPPGNYAPTWTNNTGLKRNGRSQ